MIPRIAKTGRNFVSAGLYYMNDKIADQIENQMAEPTNGQKPAQEYYLFDKNEQTSERVLHTETLNLPTQDAHKAMKVMAWTFMHHKEIRQNAVALEAQSLSMSLDEYVRKYNPYRGRKPEKPVYCYSLAWRPDQDPTPKHMVETAKDSLKHLGLDKHQAVLVIHSDTEHKHIHVIANRLNPDTGLMWCNGNDRNRMSLWAEKYERQHGQILSPQRVANNERRRRGEKVYYKELSRTEWESLKRQGNSPLQIQEARLAKQQQERERLERRKHSAIAKAELDLSKRYEPVLNNLVAQSQALEKKITERDQRFLSHGLAGKIARFVSNRYGDHKKNQTAHAALRGDIAEIQQSIDQERAAAKTQYANDWIEMERRHAAELSSVGAKVQSAVTHFSTPEAKRARAPENTVASPVPSPDPLSELQEHELRQTKKVRRNAQRKPAPVALQVNSGTEPRQTRSSIARTQRNQKNPTVSADDNLLFSSLFPLVEELFGQLGLYGDKVTRQDVRHSFENITRHKPQNQHADDMLLFSSICPLVEELFGALNLAVSKPSRDQALHTVLRNNQKPFHLSTKEYMAALALQYERNAMRSFAEEDGAKERSRKKKRRKSRDRNLGQRKLEYE